MEVAEAVNEVEALHNLVQGKEAAADAIIEKDRIKESVKRKYWQRKQAFNYLKGLFHFGMMVLFIILCYQTHNQIVLITESHQLRLSLTQQIWGKTVKEMPTFYARPEEVYTQLGKL